MAPKRKTNEAEKTSVAPPSPRRTRSSTRKENSSQTEVPLRSLSKKAKISKDKGKDKEVISGEEEQIPKKEGGGPMSVVKSKTIVIEACKQCNSFKRTAERVKNGLETAVPDVQVKINPEKPRRGYFEIRDGSGNCFISLPSMKRPFTKMKELDLDEVVSDITDKIK